MGEIRLDASDVSFLGASVRTNCFVHSNIERGLKVDVAAVWEVVGQVVGVTKTPTVGVALFLLTCHVPCQTLNFKSTSPDCWT